MKTFLSSISIIISLLWYTGVFQPAFSQESDPIWKFVRSTSSANITSMLSDSVGNCYLTGTFYSSSFRYGNDSVPGIDNDCTNTFILKTDPTGKLIWLHSIFPLTPGADIYPKKLVINERGEAAVIFTVSGSDSIIIDNQVIASQTVGIHTYVVKILKNKSIGWVRQINSTPYHSNNGMLTASDMFMEESGQLYITGYFNGNSAFILGQSIPGMHEYAALFVARIESSGDVAWLQGCPIDTTVGSSNIWSTTIRNAPGNNFYIGGYHDGNQYFHFGDDTLQWAIGQDAFIAGYTKDGVSHWAQSLKSDGIDLPDAIVALQNGDVIFMGYSNGSVTNMAGTFYFPGGFFNIYLARFQSDGNVINTSEIAVHRTAVSSPGDNASLNRDMSDNLILCAEFQSSVLFTDVFSMTNPDPGSDDMFIAKLNSATFSPLWTFHGTAPGYNTFESVKIDKLGNVYFSGTIYNNLTLGAVPIVANISDGTPYTASVNTDGTFNYTYWQSNDATNHLSMISTGCDIYGNTFVAGSFSGPANTLGPQPVISTDLQGIFLAKYARVKDIVGFVNNNQGVPVVEGYVKIYGYTYYQKSPLNDSVLIEGDGSFYFNDIPYGRYLIVAQPTDVAAEDYIRTYFPSAFYWEFGQQITVDANGPDMIFGIILQQNHNFDGNTAMDGNVSDNNETKNTSASSFDKGRPVKRATVTLAGNQRQKATYEVVATTETDDEGNFAFYNVTDGDYYLWVDYPGLPVQDIYFVTVSGHQFVSNLDYLVTEEVVTPAGFPEYSALQTPNLNGIVEIYPNPCVDYINVCLDKSSQCVIDIFDAKGVFIKHLKLTSDKTQIDISTLDPGNYLIRIMNEEIIAYDKFSVVR